MHKRLEFIRENNIRYIEDIAVQDTLNKDKKRICFLDIDGVIQPYGNQYRFNYDMDKTVNYLCEKFNNEIFKDISPYDVCAAYYDWSNIGLGFLREFLDITVSYIVISSDWRKDSSLEKMKALFSLYGMENYVIDICGEGSKKEAIENYLKEHSNEIEKYIVLDDYDFTMDFGTDFYRTSNFLDEKDYNYLRFFMNNKMSIENKDNYFDFFANGKYKAKVEYKIFDLEKDKVLLFNLREQDFSINSANSQYILNYLVKFASSLDCSGIATTKLLEIDEYKPFLEKSFRKGQKIYRNDGCVGIFTYISVKSNTFKIYDFLDENQEAIIDECLNSNF